MPESIVKIKQMNTNDILNFLYQNEKRLKKTLKCHISKEDKEDIFQSLVESIIINQTEITTNHPGQYLKKALKYIYVNYRKKMRTQKLRNAPKNYTIESFDVLITSPEFINCENTYFRNDETAEDLYINKHTYISVHRMVNNLKAKRQQQAIRLRFFDEMEIKDIAEIMNCSYDTAKSNYNLGLLNMKKTEGYYV